MTPERFAQLAQAYGADLARWPMTERARALRFEVSDPVEAERLLKAAGELDEWMAASRIAPPSDALIDRICSAAQVQSPAQTQSSLPAPVTGTGTVTSPRAARGWRALLGPVVPGAASGRGWLVAGFTGVGVAGVFAGSLFASILLGALASTPTGEAMIWGAAASAFGDPTQDWGLE